MTLLGVLVCALQDRVLLDGCHCLLLVHTTQPSVRDLLAAAEVNSALNLAGVIPLCRLPVLLGVRIQIKHFILPKLDGVFPVASRSSTN